MTTLAQIAAVLKGKKADRQAAITALYKSLGTASLFNGLTKTYSSIVENEAGEQIPPENKEVQLTVEQLIGAVRKLDVPLLDIILTQDVANTTAKATLLGVDVPVSNLLWLEKYLTDLSTFVKHIPVLDNAKTWTKSKTSGLYETADEWKQQMRKVMVPVTLAPATEHHPAQVQLVSEDRPMFKVTTRNFSGAIPATERDELCSKLSLLLDQVKLARASANAAAVTDQKIGNAIFDFLFAPAKK